MIDLSYRISCVISVPTQALLAHAFHIERKKVSINETYNRPAASLDLEGGQTMDSLFEPMIQAYATEFGIVRDQIVITKYLAASGHPDIMVSFWDGIDEDKFETTKKTMKAIAYKKAKVNLGYGLELYEYISKLPNNTFALRVGPQVPAGDVNLAYVHTPRLNAEENISMIDTAYVNENVIPPDQIESIVVPDGNGVLSYADVLGPDQPIVKRPPYDRFPSKNINLTRRFSRSDGSLESALFYKMELKYHYDSTPGEPGKVVRYGGNQIQITDENGNSLPDTFRYLIYAQASEINSKIFWVKIYLQFNTGEVDTFKVRYNHVDKPVAEDMLKSVAKTVELYGNASNQDGVTSEVFVEGGKLRIVNGTSAYRPVALSAVKTADDTQEVYAIEEHPDRDGYRITVPQKSMRDPRPHNMFNHKLSGTFKDENGKDKTITFGYVTDWVLNKESLLDHEKIDYEIDKKMIGLRAANSAISGRDMITMMLPLSVPSLPADTIFEIHDADGTLLYTTTSAGDNSQVTTTVNGTGSEIPTAAAADKANPWTGVTGGNVRIKNNPIPHLATIFPERQKNKYDFDWEASGEGETSSTLSYNSKWRVCQDITIVEEHNTTAIQAFQGWDFIGTDLTRGKWVYSKSSDELQCTVNAVEVSGYFNGAHTSKKDYIFSACVRVTDPGDDDMIGLVFRVQDSQHYYIFVWEKQDMMTKPDSITGNGVGRILIDERGVSAALYYDSKIHKPSDVNPNYQDVWDLSQYLNNTGMAPNKLRIFKASPSNLPPYSDAAAPNCQYKADKTGLMFEDITGQVNMSRGWTKGEQYKIRVVVQGSQYQVHIGNDTSDAALGALACSATDSSYQTGSYGLQNISQEQTFWSKMRYTEINGAQICSDWAPVTLTSNNQVQLSNQTADAILKPLVDKYIKDTYGANYPVMRGEPYGIGFDADMVVTIRRDSGGYVWGSTRNPQAGGVIKTPWKTSDNGKNIKGTGKVTLLDDGTVSVIVAPVGLTRSNIPGTVLNFSWNRVWQTSGDSVTLSIGSGDTIIALGNVPPINPVGNPYTIPQDMILKSEGLKKLADLFEAGGIYEKLGIPASVPMSEVLLRIERGDGAGANKEHRVNYRWRYLQGGLQRFEVDQAYGGVNRIRLKNILKPDGKTTLDNLRADFVAWTNFEDLESMPILAIKLDDNRKIEAEKPKVEDKYMDMDNWYVRVKNGRVKRRLRLPFYEPSEQVPQMYVSYPELASYAPSKSDDNVEVVLDYTVPEYSDQEFLSRPVMLVERETPLILNDKMIQTRFAPLVLQSEAGISYLEVQALRMNGARKLRISDVDSKKGIIYLHDKIRDEDEVVVRYAYEEDWYTYRGYATSILREETKIGVPIPLSLNYTASLQGNGVRKETQPGGAPLKKALLLWDQQNPATYNVGLISLLQTLGMTVETDQFTAAKANEYDLYDLIITTFMSIRKPPEILTALRNYMNNGGNAIVTGEHANLPDWNANLMDITADFPDLVLHPDMITTVNGTFNTSHPLTAGCTTFQMSAASYFTITGERIIPVCYANGVTVVAVYENAGQRIVFMTDCNFMDNNGFNSEGNRKMIENIVTWAAPIEVDVTGSKNSQIKSTFTKAMLSQADKYDETIVITSIPVYDGFGVDMKGFIDEFKADTLTLQASGGIDGSTLAVKDSKVVFRSDGKPVGQRNATIDDIIDISVTVTVPTVTEKLPRADQFFHLDLNPSPGHQYTVAKTGFREWVPGDLKERDPFSLADRSTNQLLVKQMHLYLRPTSIWIQEEGGSKIIDGTTRTQAIYHTDQGEFFDMDSTLYDPTMMRLGKFIAQPNARIDSDMIILDTRTRGGGLDEAIEKSLIAEVNKESMHNWDIGFFDGEAYQENGVMIIRLPSSILRSPANPNGFHESEVQAALAKHKGYGILPIIEYFDEVKKSLNIIGNDEFLLGQNCEFYNPLMSTGVYFIEYDNSGTGDNMLLKLKDDATYGVSVPASRLQYPKYQIDIKARKRMSTTDNHSAGQVIVSFKDESKQIIALGTIVDTDWLIYRATVELQRPVARVDIRACYGTAGIKGDIDIDYIKMTPIFVPTENLEIIDL